MGIRVKNKGRFIRAIIALVLIIFLFAKGIGFLFDKVSALVGDKTEENAKVSTAIDTLNGEEIERAENGNMLFEQNDSFEKYTIKLSKSTEKDYSEDSNFIYINLDSDQKVSLDKNSFDDAVVKNLIQRENYGEKQIIIRKQWKKNNFVYLDKGIDYIQILISKSEEPFSKTIAVDAGHGGNDPGTASKDGSIVEKDYNLTIAKMIKPNLIYNGYKVKMIREDDKFVELEDITAAANKSNAEIFISIHLNYFKESTEENGIETYYYNKTEGGSESAILAQQIQSAIVKSDNWNDRGIKKEDFYVVRYTKMPAVLVECGFLSSPSDIKKLKNQEVLKNIADNISQGALNYLKTEN